MSGECSTTVEVSTERVQRAFKRNNLKSAVKTKKPLLSEKSLRICKKNVGIGLTMIDVK